MGIIDLTHHPTISNLLFNGATSIASAYFVTTLNELEIPANLFDASLRQTNLKSAYSSSFVNLFEDMSDHLVGECQTLFLLSIMDSYYLHLWRNDEYYRDFARIYSFMDFNVRKLWVIRHNWVMPPENSFLDFWILAVCLGCNCFFYDLEPDPSITVSPNLALFDYSP